MDERLIEAMTAATALFHQYALAAHQYRVVKGECPAAQAPMLADMDTNAFSAALFAALRAVESYRQPDLPVVRFKDAEG